MFLHDKGYDYFTINKLTFPEIFHLLKHHNKKIREENRKNRINQKKRGKR